MDSRRDSRSQCARRRRIRVQQRALQRLRQSLRQGHAAHAPAQQMPHMFLCAPMQNQSCACVQKLVVLLSAANIEAAVQALSDSTDSNLMDEMHNHQWSEPAGAMQQDVCRQFDYADKDRAAPALQLQQVVKQPAAGVRQVRDGVRQRHRFTAAVLDAAVQRVRHIVGRAEALQRRHPPVHFVRCTFKKDRRKCRLCV